MGFQESAAATVILFLDILVAYVLRIQFATELFLFEIMLPRREYEFDREDERERDGCDAFETYLDSYWSRVNFYLYCIGIFLKLIIYFMMIIKLKTN